MSVLPVCRLSFADWVPAYAYNLGWNYQRSKSIRSPTGYVGLFNLSNTCYLNSLFTQLFMNVAFRGFMLNANVPDADGSQKLLAETQKLFAYMQNSWHVAIEPRDLIASIKNYNNEHIDVAIQMDVDEFYSLIFDRWEGQILNDEDKKVFRSFYGGLLVQQIKSKECQHVKEKEEPFLAIQCDIKGKSTLQESLEAYVEGDMMEGSTYPVLSLPYLLTRVETINTIATTVVATSMPSKGTRRFPCRQYGLGLT